MRDIRKLFVHCSDTPMSMDIGADTIREWHVTGRGWRDIGYTKVIKRDGTLEAGRPIEQTPAAQRGHNKYSIAVCLIGGRGKNGLPEFNYTAAQLGTLEALVWSYMDRFGLERSDIFGHNDVSTKACPCFNVRAWAQGL